MTARKTVLMRESGPYKVHALANGKLLIEPVWPLYPDGAPGPLTRLGLAEDFQEWLNNSIKGNK